MLTVAYCRVSTEEQAAEGFSIEGQASKLTTYAELHDLGRVVVITDPGRSGKDLNRPGLQQLLAMVEEGHVSHVIAWRLDRLSRNLSDLILLADRFGQHDVALHSFSERIDLSSATGRMFYNILGSFAQFYREQLSENVRMGMHQAAKQGRWINRPPTGYDLIDGRLIANDDSQRVQAAFRMRAEGASHRQIAETTGMNHSTVLHVLQNRVYLGETQIRDEWFDGIHDGLVTPEQFEAAHRGRIKGRRRGRDLLSGHVRCGLCQRVMTIDQRNDGRTLYRCRHRGQGCKIPRRPTQSLLQAALLGIQLIGHDSALQDAIRKALTTGRTGRPPAGGRPAQPCGPSVKTLRDRQQQLLALHYGGQISAELFQIEESQLAQQIRIAEHGDEVHDQDEQTEAQLVAEFEEVAALLGAMDIAALFSFASEVERRQLIDELIESVIVQPDHLQVKIHGAPSLNVALAEVGLRVENNGVGGPDASVSTAGRLEPWQPPI